MSEETNEHRCGYVAIIGRPNVGKSTLLNRVLGQKISIVSRKPQTTRNRILGLYNRDDAQVVFLDTPGIHEAQSPINRRMVDAAVDALSEVDLVIFMIDVAGSAALPERNRLVLDALEKRDLPVVAVLNKIDRVKRPDLLPLLAAWDQAGTWEAIVPVSAEKGDGVGDLLREIVGRLPESPPFFPKDQLTDVSERFIVSELVREKVFRLTGQEIPYATAVEVEEFEEVEGKDLVRIMARIWVERDTQKAMVIGRGGRKLKEIGTAARLDIERLLGCRVYLQLTVGTKSKWTHDRSLLQRLGNFRGGAGE
ncbi:MAG: GTPase Era [Deltaproteobacteria bacterium]|nr:GTPase Era [Deltaproteobacteria bacterium]